MTCFTVAFLLSKAYLDFHDVRYLLPQLHLEDLCMREHAHYLAVLLDAVKLELDILYTHYN
jgi:hypothetical protein